MIQPHEFPREVIVDPKEKLVMLTPQVEQALPDAVEAFQTIDERIYDDLEQYMEFLEDAQFTFRSSTGAPIDCALIPGKGSELLVMWAPFSDSKPNSSGDDIYQYMYDDPKDPISKAKAAPNSWNQTTKLAITADLLRAVGREMSVLTIFSPMPSVPRNAYSSSERKQVKRGNFTAAGRITAEAIAEAQNRLHGTSSETQFDQLHLHGASLGAITAIGAANGLLLSDKARVRTVTAQELIIAPKSRRQLAKRFVRDGVGEVSGRILLDDPATIAEPLLRQLIDRDGYEFLATNIRMIRGMSKLGRLKGMTRPERNQTPRIIENLLKHEVSVVIPLAENSSLTQDTRQYLPNSGEKVVRIRAIKGEKVAHLVDEHVAVTALMTALNIRQTKS